VIYIPLAKNIFIENATFEDNFSNPLEKISGILTTLKTAENG